MADRLDMSLDDIIAKKKAKQPEGHRGHFSPRGRSYGPGPTRRPMYSRSVRSPPYFASPKVQVGRRSMFEQGRVVSVKEDTEEGTKLYLSNLHYDVSNSDIELLFSDIGHLKRHSVHYDRSGRSKGTAEVIYVHRADALTAIEKYSNRPLDGKRIQIELVGGNPATPLPVLPTTQRFLRTPNAFFRGSRGRVGARELSRGCGTADCGLEKGRTQIKKRGEKLTAEELDADLENYHQRARRVK